MEVTELEPDVAVPAMVAGDDDLVIAEEYPGHPLPHRPAVEPDDLMADAMLLATLATWRERSLNDMVQRPFDMEPCDSPAGRWAPATCRSAGFEPGVRYTTTDLQIHLRLVEAQLAVALLPELSGVRDQRSVTAQRLRASPVRNIYTAVRRGASEHPAIRAFITAVLR